MNLKMILNGLVIMLIACNPQVNKETEEVAPTPSSKVAGDSIHYDLLHPQNTWMLPATLKEISGLSYVDGNHLVAIEDLHAALYLLRLDSSAAIEKTIPFRKADDTKFDIEDVALVKDTAYALWSHGTIFRILHWMDKPVVDTFNTNLDKDNNTEGLCFDPVTNELLIACKGAAGVEDEKKSTKAIYTFNTTTRSLGKEPMFLIQKKEFEKVAGQKIGFFPSAVAVHPVTHDIYILSTKENKCLAVFSHDGQLKAFSFLDKDLFPQPEGICFAPDGKLFICTQGRHGEAPAIYAFGARG